jgi:hypothetical protein
MAILPATGSAITMGRVRKGHANIAAASGQNISLRGTLGGHIGISTGAVSLSSRFGGRTTPYNDL